MVKGIPLIISGPSGSGKDTLLNRFFESHPEVIFSISSVTRPPRGSEEEDGKYNFVSTDEFKSMIENDQLFEYNIYLGNYYGTPKQPIFDALNDGHDIIMEIDVNGAAQIRKSLPEAVSIFIMPPSMDVLRCRLIGRNTENEETANKRLSEAVREIVRANEYDYIIVNDHLDEAVNKLYSIIVAEKARVCNMKKFINEVQKNA